VVGLAGVVMHEVDRPAVIDYASPDSVVRLPWWMVTSATIVFLGCVSCLVLWFITPIDSNHRLISISLSIVPTIVAILEWRALRRPGAAEVEILAMLFTTLTLISLALAGMSALLSARYAFDGQAIAAFLLGVLPAALFCFLALAHAKWSR
jgi:hypothetical protein